MYPIKIRADHGNGRELTQTEATFAAMGLDERIGRLYVTAVYAEDTQGPRRYGDERDVYKAGTPVFGLEAEIFPRRVRYGQDEDATLTMAGTGSHSPEVAMVRAQCYMLAAQIAATANAAAQIAADA